MRTANILIHQHNIAHNLVVLKSLAPNRKLLAMVKANAYGHGVEFAVPAMSAADGFGVACFSEAVAVKNALVADDNRPIVLMQGVFGLDEWRAAIEHHFSCVIKDDEQLNFALTHQPSPTSHTHTIWLKYNTGMNRLGFKSEHILNRAEQLLNAGYQIVLTSHFACADEKDNPLNDQQIAKFQQIFTTLHNQFGNRVQASLCNSAGIVNFEQCHYDWVRTGIAMYGSTPVADKSAGELGLKPAMSLTAKIMAIQPLCAGESLGYGATWQANKDSTIGIVSLGYGDGYPRVVNNANVLINNELVPIVGRVAMDMIAIDLTDKAGKIGDEVLFWGQQGDTLLSIDDIANCAGTIGYELMCRLTTRADRKVVK